jgi:hypothetical protein
MGNTYRRTAGGLIAIGIGAGCASGATTEPATLPPESAEKVEQSIERSLERLNALQIVAGARLVLDLPAEATACYGVPCPESTWVGPYQAERARQAPRLDQLATLAEATVTDPNLVLHDKSEADAAIRALNGLAVIEVGALVQAAPANNGQCYNLPCPEDVEAADRVNAARVSQVFAIVDAANKNGL